MAIEFSLLGSAGISFLAVFLAEFGDKSQIVCMTLAATYAARMVLSGAIAAFVLLNMLAVVIGSTIASAIPPEFVMGVAATLFTYFGIRSLMYKESGNEGDVHITNENIFIAVFIMIFVAELGDKTQLTIMSLSATKDSIGVWLGATAAVILTSAIGVYAGNLLLSKINKETFHKIGGLVFLTLAAITVYRYFY